MDLASTNLVAAYDRIMYPGFAAESTAFHEVTFLFNPVPE